MPTPGAPKATGRTGRSQSAKPGYLPTLDGWRAIAIVSVILCHCRYYAFGPVSTGWFYIHGEKGVDLFFAISGILICSRLLEEERAFGRISLDGFYIRRAFRILPPAILMLSITGVLTLTDVFKVTLREWFGALFFFHNYTSLFGPLGPDSFFLGHFWSLSVEEHFYLILPAVLVVTRKGWRLPILICLTLLVEIHRMLVLKTETWGQVSRHTGIRLDSLLIPAILAVILQGTGAKELLKKWLRAWPIPLIGVLLVVTYGGDGFWQDTAIAALMPLVVLGSVLNSQSYLGRFLELPVLRYIGRISYSLYLWQELFFVGHYHPNALPLGNLERFPWQVIAVLATAMGSYYLLERPMIRFGHKLAPPASPGRGDLAENLSPEAPVTTQVGTFPN